MSYSYRLLLMAKINMAECLGCGKRAFFYGADGSKRCVICNPKEKYE